MGLKLVLKGIGQGSIFGYGRILGVHNPFGAGLDKLGDPFINLSTFCKIARQMILTGQDEKARSIVVDNLSRRINMGLLTPIDIVRLFVYGLEKQNLPSSFGVEAINRAEPNKCEELFRKFILAIVQGKGDLVVKLAGSLEFHKFGKLALPVLIKIIETRTGSNYGFSVAYDCIENITDEQAVPQLLAALKNDFREPDNSKPPLQIVELSRSTKERCTYDPAYDNYISFKGHATYERVTIVEFKKTYGSRYPIREAAVKALMNINAKLMNENLAKAIKTAVLSDNIPITVVEVEEICAD